MNTTRQKPTNFLMLAVNQLSAGVYQPRKDFNAERLAELADSIRTQGLIEPLVVRAISSNQYEIIAGERRWRAAQLAGLEQVPCVVGEYNDQQACAVGLIENIQRQDLNLIEEATAYARLQEEFGFVQEDIANMVGKSRSHVANIMRLLTLTPAVQQQVASHALSLGHARMLVGLPTQMQQQLATEIISNDITVRALEARIRQMKTEQHQPPPSPQHSRDVARLTELLSEQVGAPVEIDNQGQAGGWLKIKYFDNDTLAGLLQRFGLLYDIEDECP